MQKIIFYIGILLLTLISKVYAQDGTFEGKAKEIALRIETITNQEKKALKAEVEQIEVQLNGGLLTKEEADSLKLKAAEKRATNIEQKVAIEEAKLQQLIQDKVDGKYKTVKKENEQNLTQKDSIFIKGKKYEVTYLVSDSTDIITDFKRIFKRDSIYKERRTTSQIVIAGGLNNLVTNGSVANSEYGYWRSAFWEWGITYRTNLIKDNKKLNLKYGLSFMYNLLHATDNRYFVENDNQTILATFPIDLKDKETYFKNVYIAIPLHLEFDFSKVKIKNDKKYYESHSGFRFGIGGFVGYNINSKQFLSYEENGKKINVRQKGDWNVNDWNYGVSAYIGYAQWSLYTKYDLNPLFKNNSVDQKNISLGMRFDFN